MARVLVVEDDPTVSGVLVAYLRRAGFDPVVAADGPTALQQWGRVRPDVVVLDVLLPGLSGLEVLRRRRDADDDSAVIVLSALGEEDDRLLGLDLGADDYVTKPYSPREVVGRVQALLRRSERLGERTGARPLLPRRLVSDGLWLDLAARTAGTGDGPVTLTQREFDLLAHFMGHPGEAFSKEQLLRRVWGWDFGDASTVTVHVRRLREKVEDDPSDPRRVVTLRGTGYRFDGQVAVDG